VSPSDAATPSARANDMDFIDDLLGMMVEWGTTDTRPLRSQKTAEEACPLRHCESGSARFL
jgi:hypothetical protein